MISVHGVTIIKFIAYVLRLTIFVSFLTTAVSTASGDNSVNDPLYHSRQVLIVAGNFSLDNQLVNIAQFDLSSGE
jgi:hypothetical protein